MATRKRDRFFALFGALLFFVTASFFTIVLIWNGISNHNQSKNSSKDNSSKTLSSCVLPSTPPAPTSKTGSTKLEGTTLQNFTPCKVPSLLKEDLQVGTGNEVQPGDTVTVDYTGAVAATGLIFQSSLDSGQPVSFGLNGVIKGWTDGVPGMKVGGTRRLYIPADQAYGATPPAGSNIPANADLVFDITLHKVGG